MVNTQIGCAFLAELKALLDMATYTKRHVTVGSRDERILAIIAPLTLPQAIRGGPGCPANAGPQGRSDCVSFNVCRSSE